jgi:glycosyltransferase involved in cell wall biosynthesis
MKILFINNARGRGGGEEFLRDLLPGLARKGVRVGLVCRPGSPLAGMFSEAGITLHQIDRSGFGALSSVFTLANVITSNGYEIVNIQRSHDVAQGWLGALLSGRKPRLIYTVQVAEFLKSRFLLSRMDRIVTISRHIRDKLVQYSPALASRVSIIYYGIATDSFSVSGKEREAFRAKFDLTTDTPVIGTVGDLWKNQIEFLDALAIIRKSVPNVRFAITASDSGAAYAEAFKHRAAELGLSDVLLWTGRLSKDDMRAFYAGIDLGVSTHRNEGFGIWILEALSMGVPVVGVNEGGIRDSLESCPAGSLVAGDADAMAAEVLTILNDPARRSRMSEAGPRWVRERFSVARMTDEYKRFFQEGNT